MDQAIQDGRRQLLVVEDGVPLIERQVGRDDHAPSLVTGGNRFKEQLRTDSLKGDET